MSSSQVRTPARGRSRGLFLKQFIVRPTQIGAIAPSSSHLARQMVKGLDLGGAHAVIEFGPGCGAFTPYIIERLGAQTKYFAVELNPGMAAAWRERFPQRSLVEGDVRHVAEHCRRQGIEPGKVDIIISGLPWASFPQALQEEILDGVLKVLKPGGVLVTFGYHVGKLTPAGRRFYRRLPELFADVRTTGSVWRNLPPAFVLQCRTAGG